MARAKQRRRRGGGGNTKAARSAASSRSSLKRIRNKEKRMRAKVAGIGATYFAAGWWGERVAEAELGVRDEAGFTIMGTELDGTKIGVGVALAGAWGVTGDELYDEAAYAAGLGIIAADRAMTKNAERMLEGAPSE